MAKLTRQQASARSKKGWETRKRKNGLSRKRKAVLAVPAVRIAGHVLADHRRLTKNQHVWTRPNGEKIRLKGFTEYSLPAMREAAGHADSKLRNNITLSDHRLNILNKKPPRRMGRASGMYREGERAVFKHTEEKIGEHLGRGYRTALRPIIRVIGSPKHDTINVDPDLGKEKMHVLLHEMGHAVDRGDRFSGTKRFRRKSGWKVSAKAGTGDKGMRAQANNPYGQFTPKGSASVKIEDVINAGDSKTKWSEAYQLVSPSEDFAESFRHSIAGPNHQHAGLSNTVLTKDRAKYMRGKIVSERQAKVTANIQRRHGIHDHYDKFLVGGAVVAGAGYGVYRYKTDPRFHRYVDDKSRRAKRRVNRYRGKR